MVFERPLCVALDGFTLHPATRAGGLDEPGREALLNMHKMNAVRLAIVDAGATVIDLPTYSPELNPIEMLWADMKRDLRTLAVNVESELAAAIRRLRDAAVRRAARRPR